MVTLPGVMLMSIESNRISPSLVTSSGIATTAGSIRLPRSTSAATRKFASSSSHAKKGRQAHRVNCSGGERRRHHATPAEEREDRVADHVAHQQVHECDLTLQCGPGEREENAAKQHQ